ncbi:DinB family protein [Ekhidna sp. MALMAid0563]|uniref:DinB family protein n=1 Tax=Ekhidna sp. MALMAid0563 TaxID=3143937 RepID=UPI0032DF72AF
MKKYVSTITLMLAWIIGSSFNTVKEGDLTKEDRKYVISYLKQSQKKLFSRIKDLSVEQWTFKATDTTWSPAEICEHIFKAESSIISRADAMDTTTWSPRGEDYVQEKVQFIIDFLQNRERKFNAPERLQPENQFSTPKAFLSEFKQKRGESIDYVNEVEKPLKGYYKDFGPLGEISGYHWLVFISAHTQRHIKQLDEVLENPDFPI